MGIDSKKYINLDRFNVSRETIELLDYYKNLLLEKNKEINLISRKDIGNLVKRHIEDSAQAIDLIDLNNKMCTDLGSGGGLPGVVISIMLREKKSKTKLKLYEKSYHKSNFLREVREKLKLDFDVHEKDLFKEKNIISGTVIARAFKPLPIILELIDKNFSDLSNLVVFMGKNGKQLLENTIKKWEFEYKNIRSTTSKDSFLINIKNVKKR